MIKIKWLIAQKIAQGSGFIQTQQEKAQKNLDWIYIFELLVFDGILKQWISMKAPKEQA